MVCSKNIGHIMKYVEAINNAVINSFKNLVKEWLYIFGSFHEELWECFMIFMLSSSAYLVWPYLKFLQLQIKEITTHIKCALVYVILIGPTNIILTPLTFDHRASYNVKPSNRSFNKTVQLYFLLACNSVKRIEKWNRRICFWK